MDIVVENGCGDQSSDPGWGSLHLTQRQYHLDSYESQ